MRAFKEHIELGEVRSQTPNEHEAVSLIVAAKGRMEYFLSQPLTEQSARFVVENSYEAIRELLDALLAKRGFKSYSHQAPIVYARELSIFSDKDAILCDQLRDLRHRSKYYAAAISVSTANQKVAIAKQLYDKLLAYLSKH